MAFFIGAGFADAALLAQTVLSDRTSSLPLKRLVSVVMSSTNAAFTLHWMGLTNVIYNVQTSTNLTIWATPRESQATRPTSVSVT